MGNVKNAVEKDPEIAAISVVYGALEALDEAAQSRVIRYVAGKLGIRGDPIHVASERSDVESRADMQRGSERTTELLSDEIDSDSSDEISPVALKWLKRNGLSTDKLAKLYSLGSEEIDLVSETVPGKSKRERMYNVILLTGMAAYLGSGAARVSDKEVRETCLHYDAFDSANFATHLKKFASEISGTKQSGYTLNPRGLTAATKLVKEMTQNGD